MTPRQKQLLDWMIARGPDAPDPSFEEMAVAMRVRSKSIIDRRLRALVEQGAVVRTGGAGSRWRRYRPAVFVEARPPLPRLPADMEVEITLESFSDAQLIAEVGRRGGIFAIVERMDGGMTAQPALARSPNTETEIHHA